MFELLILEQAKFADIRGSKKNVFICSVDRKRERGQMRRNKSHEQFVVVERRILSRSKGGKRKEKGQTTSDYECTTFIAFSLSFHFFFPLMCLHKRKKSSPRVCRRHYIHTHSPCCQIAQGLLR